MRRRFTVPIVAIVAVLPWLWFYPDLPQADQTARLVSVVDVERDANWIGGLSGFDLTADGTTFHFVTDRGYWAQGRLARDGERLSGLEIEKVQRLVDRFGKIRKFPSTDAEGLALRADGSVFVSFEHHHRVLAYDTWDSPARWPSYTRSWRALSSNAGLEALAIAPDGTLFTIPEGINTDALEQLVYHRPPDGKWRQTFTLPIDPNFSPVGADFGPDGRLYVLERGIYPFGFYSRVRAMALQADEFSDIETVLQTGLAAHGNLEGLAVWQDQDGLIRLTMVSDDNFYPFMRGQIVEYVVEDRVATQPQ